MVTDRLEAAFAGRAIVVAGDEPRVNAQTVDDVKTALRIGRELGVSVGVGRGAIALDLTRLRDLRIDETSLYATVGVGWTAAELEVALVARGLSLGALPQASMSRTIGALLAAPRPTEAQPRLGRFTHAVAALSATLADGADITTLAAPRKAAGPELFQALIGTRGTLGIITECVLRIVRRADTRSEAAWEFPGPFAALRTARALLLDGVRPFEVTVAVRPAQLLVTLDGPGPLVEAEHVVIGKLAARFDGKPVPHQPLPRYASLPMERYVALDRLTDAQALGEASRVVGWHLGGAAFVDPSAAYVAPTSAPLIIAALKQRFDPKSHLVGF